MNERILIVEDDKNLRLTLQDNLELEGYEVMVAASLTQARDIVVREGIDLCVLDIMLPDGDGYEFSRWLRGRHRQILILMLTARILECDMDTGFEAGADDYVNKPYRLKELLLRIKALLRRRTLFGAAQPEQTDINGYTVNWAARQVKRNDEEIHLTKKEFGILLHLYNHLNQVQSRDDILEAVWGKAVYIDNRTVDNFISNLKKLLDLVEGRKYYIKSIRGVGYCLQGDVS